VQHERSHMVASPLTSKSYYIFKLFCLLEFIAIIFQCYIFDLREIQLARRGRRTLSAVVKHDPFGQNIDIEITPLGKCIVELLYTFIDDLRICLKLALVP